MAYKATICSLLCKLTDMDLKSCQPATLVFPTQDKQSISFIFVPGSLTESRSPIKSK